MPETPELIVCARRVAGVEGAEAVAVSGGAIAAVGPRRDVLALRGPATRVIEAPRGLVCPGFHDAHFHLVPAAAAWTQENLRGLDLRGIADSVRRATARRAPNRWIVGRGFDPELFRGAGVTPRALLDEAAPWWPVLLWSHDHHTAALNTNALVLAGFLPRPPEIPGGTVERGDDAAPTGLLREMAATMAAVHADDFTEDELAEAVVSLQPAVHRAGLTAVHDMGGSRHLEVLRALDAAGRLQLDVFASLSPGDAVRADLRAPGRALRIAGMKAYLDGALGSRTAHLLEPYEDEAQNRGFEVLDRATARRFVTEAAAAGLPSWLHAIGDAAVRAALDVLGDARAPDGRVLRHRVEHAQMIAGEDLPRFAAQGIVASVQPVHMAVDAPLVLRFWGSRSRAAFPLRRLLDSGAAVAFGSDAPIETFDPLEGIRCAVLRRGRDGTVLHPSEAVTPAEAIEAYTSGPRRALGLPPPAIAPGARADLTVLGEDIAARPEALPDCTVTATVVHGRAAFVGQQE